MLWGVATPGVAIVTLSVLLYFRAHFTSFHFASFVLASSCVSSLSETDGTCVFAQRDRRNLSLRLARPAELVSSLGETGNKICKPSAVKPNSVINLTQLGFIFRVNMFTWQQPPITKMIDPLHQLLSFRNVHLKLNILFFSRYTAGLHASEG